jgi:hypothetical protein
MNFSNKFSQHFSNILSHNSPSKIPSMHTNIQPISISLQISKPTITPSNLDSKQQTINHIPNNSQFSPGIEKGRNSITKAENLEKLIEILIEK